MKKYQDFITEATKPSHSEQNGETVIKGGNKETRKIYANDILKDHDDLGDGLYKHKSTGKTAAVFHYGHKSIINWS